MYCWLNTFLFAHQRGEEAAIVPLQMIMINILINELANTVANYRLSTHKFKCHSKAEHVCRENSSYLLGCASPAIV